jgi:hypothetical protein
VAAKGGGSGESRGRGRPKGSGSRAKEALKIVKDRPGITIPEIAEAMDIKQNYLYRVMPGPPEGGPGQEGGPRLARARRRPEPAGVGERGLTPLTHGGGSAQQAEALHRVALLLEL